MRTTSTAIGTGPLRPDPERVKWMDRLQALCAPVTAPISLIINADKPRHIIMVPAVFVVLLVTAPLIAMSPTVSIGKKLTAPVARLCHLLIGEA